MRVFFSYGHDDNRWLVEKIKEDLEKVENGSHEVWIDSEKIKFTDDWRRTISDGIHHSHMVLSFLSKHSIRDPGVCLNELAIAVGVMGGVVHSVLLENPNKVKPPVTISHLQYLDMHEWKVIKKKGEAAFEEWYLVKLNEIVKVLMDPANVRFAGEIEDLDKKLVPLSTTVDISRLLKGGFVGREWIVKEIEKWRVAANKQQVFCITGGPGIGKSAIAAYLAHHVKCHVIGVVFCRDSEAESIDPNRIV